MVATRKNANEPSVTLPLWVSDLESFRRWSDHRKFPEVGHVYYLDGVVHVDMSKEQFTHNQAKGDCPEGEGTFSAWRKPLDVS